MKKSILFIAPKFHDYHLLIIVKLEILGYIVKFYPERDYSFLFKIINNIFNKHLIKYQINHYKKIIRNIKGIPFDYLFVIRGFMMDASFIKDFKVFNPSAKTLMYQWDSNKTNPFENVIDEFDHVYSFDYEDCENFKKINYLPLFYTDDIENSKDINMETVYDFFFMGTYIPERYAAVLSFMQYIKETKYSLKTYIHIPFTSLLKEYLAGNRLDKEIVSIYHLPRSMYIDLLQKSKIVVDVSNANQTGLSMRIIEALALGKKILTNNSNIIKDKYYNTNNIFIFDTKKPIIDQCFVDNNSSQSTDILSLEKWIGKIFEI
jgi:hypothetical protein